MSIARTFRPLHALQALAPLLALGAIALIAARPAQADTLIDTTPFWGGDFGIGPWGQGMQGTQTVSSTLGQSFTVTGPDTVLTSFTFYLSTIFINDDGSPVTTAVIPYKAYLFEWNPNPTGGQSTVKGPALFQTDLLSTGLLDDKYRAITTITGPNGTQLKTGSQYIFVFSTAGVQGSTNEYAYMGLIRPNPSPFRDRHAYDGGYFVAQSSGNDESKLTNELWRNTRDFDLAFKATFVSPNAVVPEPGTFALAVAGLLPLTGMVIRRRRQ